MYDECNDITDRRDYKVSHCDDDYENEDDDYENKDGEDSKMKTPKNFIFERFYLKRYIPYFVLSKALPLTELC